MNLIYAGSSIDKEATKQEIFLLRTLAHEIDKRIGSVGGSTNERSITYSDIRCILELLERIKKENI